MEINEFLVWLTGAGGVVVASWVLERVSWFQNLKPDNKQLAFYAVCLFFGMGAFAIQTYVSAATLEQLAPVFKILSTTFGAVFLGTQFHKNNKIDEPKG